VLTHFQLAVAPILARDLDTYSSVEGGMIQGEGGGETDILYGLGNTGCRRGLPNSRTHQRCIRMSLVTTVGQSRIIL
jgi:hypothetical protein